MINLEDFTILCDIQARLRQITPDQVALMTSRLDKKEEGEKEIGPVSELCRIMWTLSVVLGSEVGLERALAKQLADPMIMEDHEQRALIASELCDVLLELLWAQARNDTGYWKSTSISIREGWMLVSAHENHPSPGIEGLMAMLRGLPRG